MAYADLFSREGGTVPLTSGVGDPAVRRDLKRLADLGLEYETSISNVEADIASIEARLSGRRNLICNGDGRVWQRSLAGFHNHAGSSTTVGVDRWWGAVNGGVQLTTDALDSVTDADGPKWIRAYVSLADAVLGVTDYGCLGHTIEGTDMAHLKWGTSNAKTVTVSFQFLCTSAGTFSVGLRNAAATRSYVHQFSYPTPNVVQDVSFTVPGCVDGSWPNTATGTLQLWFALGVGTTFSTSTLDTWQNASYISAIGNTNLLPTLFAEYKITNVQLEIGAVATEFEVLPFAEQLNWCERQLQVYSAESALGNFGVFPGFGVVGSAGNPRTHSFYILPLRTSMRTFPGMTFTAASTFSGLSVAVQTITSITSSPDGQTPNAARLDLTAAGDFSGTSGSGLWLRANNNKTAQIIAAAEAI